MIPATLETPAKAVLAACFALVALCTSAAPATSEGSYPWTAGEPPATRRLQAIEPPPGFTRPPAPGKSFAAWLRNLPLKPEGTPVRLFDGRPKPRQDVHAAVINIDVGRRDLQQCADAVMRLRAEWLYAQGRATEVAFDFTNGQRVPFVRYALGARPGRNASRWRRTARPNASYAAFRKYMTLVFAYAGTASLEKELRAVPLRDIAIGDVFIKGGFPGHAVLVADIAEHPATHEKRFLLVQSYMPAQDIHVLKNPARADGDPWYDIPEDGAPLVTPEWIFAAGSLKRWPARP